MKSQYPTLPVRPKPEEIVDWVREVVRLRQTEDISDFTNLPNLYIRGRLTTRIPTSSTDVIATDVENDIVYAADGSYVYRLLLVSGNLVWVRGALDTSW